MANDAGAQSFSEVFVGRRQECKYADTLLAEVCKGSGGALLVEGEPGVGKSRLVTEISRIAVDRGMKVLLGRCYERESELIPIPPYWPWIEILRVHDRICRVPNEEQTDGGTSLQSFLPKPDSDEASPLIGGDPAMRSFLLLDAIIRLLRRTAAADPLLIVLEDIHNAELPSLKLLGMLSQFIDAERIALFVTYQSAQVTAESHLAELVGEMAKLRNYRHILLAGISVDEVGDYVRAAVASDVSDRIIKDVHRRTDGNCLYVRELVRVISEEIGFDWAEVDDTDALIRSHFGSLIPLVSRRLRLLPDISKRLLEAAALIGRKFSLGQLSAVFGNEAPEDLHGALEPACRSAFIEHADQGFDCYSFLHVFFQDALIVELGPPIAARMRRDIGAALEQHFQDRAVNGVTKHQRPAGLTSREIEVLSHVARGKTNQEIGRDLRISENTVANHIKNIFTKTGTTNRISAASYGRRAGLFTDTDGFPK